MADNSKQVLAMASVVVVVLLLVAGMFAISTSSNDNDKDSTITIINPGEKYYKLDIEVDGEGTVAPSYPGPYKKGTTVEVLITPDYGYKISSVYLDTTNYGTTNSLNIVMNKDHDVYVEFEKVNLPSTAETLDEGKATISANSSNEFTGKPGNGTGVSSTNVSNVKVLFSPTAMTALTANNATPELSIIMLSNPIPGEVAKFSIKINGAGHNLGGGSAQIALTLDGLYDLTEIIHVSDNGTEIVKNISKDTTTVPGKTIISFTVYHFSEFTVYGCSEETHNSLPYKINDEIHWKECTDCGWKVEGMHSGTPTTTPATCTTPGEEKLECDVCKHTIIESISILTHAFDEDKTEPTCTTQGYTTYTCSYSGCGYVEVKDYVPANGHSWNNGVPTTGSDCSKGTKYTCTVIGCGATKHESTGQAHTPSNWSPVADTDTHSKICTVCKNVLEVGVCNYTEWEVETEVTCKVEGTETRTCTICERLDSRTISPIGHKWSEVWNSITHDDPTKHENCTHDRECTNCGENSEAVECTFNLIVDEETAKGTYTCIYCSHSYERDIVAKIVTTTETKYYETLDDAFNAQIPNKTITIIKEGNYSISGMPGGTVFDGNGKATLTNIHVLNDGITVRNSSIVCPITGAGEASQVKDNVTFENCIFTGEGTGASLWIDGPVANSKMSFIGCKFTDCLKLGGSVEKNNRYIFENCSFDGKRDWNKGLITAYAFVELNNCVFNYEGDAKYSVYKSVGLSTDVIEVKGTTVAIIAGKFTTDGHVFVEQKTADNVYCIGSTFEDMKYEGTVNYSGATIPYIDNGVVNAEKIIGLNSEGMRNTYINTNTVFENCTFTDLIDSYALHVDGNAACTKLTFKNCTFSGWLGFAHTVKDVEFIGCNFLSNQYSTFMNSYQNMSFTNCTFEIFGIDDELAEDQTWEFTNCVGINKCRLNETGSKSTVKIIVDGKVKVDGNSIYIYTAEELLDFANSVNANKDFESQDYEKKAYANKIVKLGENIDLAGIEWIPIGGEILGQKVSEGKTVNVYNHFSGTFDGNGKTIFNLNINASDRDYVGLFGNINSGKIINLNVENATVIGKSCVGVIAGGYTGAIDNCRVSGTIQVSGNYKVGGIIGDSYVLVTNCSVIGDGKNSFVRGSYSAPDFEGDNIGGAIGYTGEGSNVHTGIHVSNITVEGSRKVGGVIGYLNYGVTIEGSSYKEGTLKSNADKIENYVKNNKIFVGGIVGEYSGAANKNASAIKNCNVESVNILSFEYAGPIYGGTRNSVPLVEDKNSSNDVTITITVLPDSDPDYNIDGATYNFVGTFKDIIVNVTVKDSDEDVDKVSCPSSAIPSTILTQTFNGENATITGTVYIVTSGFKEATDASGGSYTFTKFTAPAMQIGAYAKEIVVIDNELGMLAIDANGGSLIVKENTLTGAGSNVGMDVFWNANKIEAGTNRAAYLYLMDVDLSLIDNEITGGYKDGMYICIRDADSTITEIEGNTATGYGEASTKSAIKIFVHKNAEKNHFYEGTGENAVINGDIRTKIMEGFTIIEKEGWGKEQYFFAIDSTLYNFEGVRLAKANSTEDLAAVLESSNNADCPTDVELGTGDIELPSLNNKDVTFTGTSDTVIDTTVSMPGTTNAALTFKGTTVEFKDGTEYQGFTHSEKVVFEDCIINGTMFLYSDTEFIRCTFNSDGNYSVWTYGSNATFEDCVFNTQGRAILVYNGGEAHATVIVSDCTFNATETYSSPKAAIEIGSSEYSTDTTYEIYINNSTADASHFFANNSTSNLWGNKNSMDKNHLNVKINGVDVY